MEKNYTDTELFELIYKVNTEFYDLVYNHVWLKDIFLVIDQKIITAQQTDFIVQVLGGPKKYGGRTPQDAHPHIFVDEEMWQIREELLKLAFIKCHTPSDIQEKWLKIDNAFKSSIIKKNLSECSKRYATDEIIYVTNPLKKAA